MTDDGYDLVERFWEASWPTLRACADECGTCKSCVASWAVGWSKAALSNPELVAKAERDGPWKWTKFGADQVQLWRCTTCGKWSHAIRRPKKHRRWVTEGQPGYENRLVEQGAYDHMNGFAEAPGHGIDCGPFIPFVAIPGGSS